MKENKYLADAAALSRKLELMRQTLVDGKAEDPFVHIWGEYHPVADAMLVVTATSSRHARGLAERLLEACRREGFEFLRMEGHDVGQWILIDCNDVMVHIFVADARALYRLEDLCKMREPIEKELTE